MLDDEEIQARDKDEECDLISQDENFDNDMSNLSSEKMNEDELKELQDYYENSETERSMPLISISLLHCLS